MLTESELLDAAAEHLRSFGLSPSMSSATTRDEGCDGHLQLRWQGRALGYQLMIKRGLRPSNIGSVARATQAASSDTLLITEQITQPMAEKLRQLGIAFVDAAGNAFLSANGLLIYVVGRRYAGRLPNAPAGRLFQDKGLRVAFALLTKPALVSSPYRVIAQSAGVAHGTVGIVMSELKSQGFVANVDGRRRLLQGDHLMRQWADAYARTLRPKLLLGVYRATEIAWWKDFDPADSGLCLGGEAGSARLTGLLVPEVITLYGSRAAAVRFQLQKRIKPDSKGNVEFLDRFWRFEQEPRELAPPLLIYADLLATGDARCIEAAASMEETLFAGLA